uniref:Methyltransferase-like protein 4 n=1 Tax=Panagrolaimus davidi TaxID=227884 RepID=A0A914P8H4_9BILA
MAWIGTFEALTALIFRFVLEGIAAGIFIYVASIEMLSTEIPHLPSKAGFVKAVIVVSAMNIFKGDRYCYFDEKEIWDKIYETSKIKIKNEFYEIWDTFKMDSEIAAAEKRIDAKNYGKKRKRKKSQNVGGAGFLFERSKIIENVWKQFIQDRNVKNVGKTSENNKIARKASENVKDFEWIEKLSKMDLNDLETVEICNGGNYEIAADKMIIFKNGSDKCVEIIVDGEEFVIPNKSAFIPAPVEGIKNLDYGTQNPTSLYSNEKYDLIILDPPWPNKSVKRLKSYNTFEIDDLYDLPIESLCHSKTTVIIWLTNNSTVHSSINRILESWNLEICSICHWLKITKNGEPISSFNSMHKVPFESFIIAFSTEMNDHQKEMNFSIIKNDFCFISTPNSCHSRKPPIGKILEQLLPEISFEKSLELYGRYLCPKTTTIGFEVLKFQHLNSNFEKCL